MFQRLGRFCGTRAWTVIAAWLLLAGLVAAVAVGLSRGPTAAYSVPGAEFESVMEQLDTQVPDAGGGSTRIVLSTENGEPFTDDQRETIGELGARLGQLPAVSGVADPWEAGEQLVSGRDELDAAWLEVDEELIALEQELGMPRDQIFDAAREGTLTEDDVQSGADAQQAMEALDTLRLGERYLALLHRMAPIAEDGATALLSLQLTEQSFTIPLAEREQILQLTEAGLPEGVTANFGLELVQDFTPLLGLGEVFGMVFAALVLLVLLRSVVAAGLPLAIAILGAGIGVALVYAASSVIDIASTDVVFALMLGLAVGVDYTLLYLYQYRQIRAQTPDVLNALGRTSAGAGRTVFYAALTNVVALAALGLSGLPFLAVMGLAGAAAIAVVAAAVLTLTPALVSLLGRRIVAQPAQEPVPDGVAAPPAQPGHPRISWIVRHPVISFIAPLLLLLVLAVPAADLRLTLPTGGEEEPSSTAYQTYDTLRAEFGPGENGRIVALVDLGPDRSEYEQFAEVMDFSRVIALDRAVDYAVPYGQSEDGQHRIIHIVPAHGPAEEETFALVVALLEERDDVVADRDLESLGYTGRAVADVELSERLTEVLPLYLGAVILVCLVIVTWLFRSLWIPLLTVGGYVLSLAAGLGVVVAVFQWGWGAQWLGVAEPGTILAFLPLLMAGLLFGLAIDYQLFITSGMREARQEGVPAWAVVNEGLRRSRPVVLACGLIMVSVFAGFVFADLQPIRQMSFAFAVGVLFEALVVRSVMIPAALQLLGERAWRLRRPRGGPIDSDNVVSGERDPARPLDVKGTD